MSEVGRLARGPSSRQDRPSGSPLGGPGDSVFFPRRGRFPYGFSPSPCRGQKAVPDVRTSDSLGARPREVLTIWNPLLGWACIAARTPLKGRFHFGAHSFARSDASRTRTFRTSRTSLPAGDSRLSEVGRLTRGPSSVQDRPKIVPTLSSHH